MKVGDIAFYTSHAIGDELIKIWTRGPYVHVGMIWQAKPEGEQWLLNATMQGIVYSPIGTPSVLWELPETYTPSPWIEQQFGARYNWVDIALDAMPTFRRYGLNIARCYDCSELVTRELIHIGYPLPSSLIDNPGAVSPNDLARGLGLIAQ